MRLRVIEYCKHSDHHMCLDENGKRRMVDLFINGDFPKETERESIVGKTVAVEYLFPLVECGMYVRIVADDVMDADGTRKDGAE